MSELVDYKYKESELKAMLKEQGLPVSGRKAQLIQRLIEADPEGMRKTVRDLNIIQCTEQGRSIAVDYLAHEMMKRAKVEDQTLNALQQGRFREASELVVAFETQQVFSRGIGIDWENYDNGRDVAMLNVMFQAKPKILTSSDDIQLGHLCLAAGMMYLWGTGQAKTWLPSNLETGLDMANDTAARMILFYTYHKRNTAGLRAAEARTVKILATDDSCSSCKELAEKKHPINKVPELPYEKCTHQLGCRCSAVIGDFDL